MSFNIGDEIVLIVNNPSEGCLRAGNKGIIRGKYKNENNIDYEVYAVEFDFDFTDMHNCERIVESGRGWFISENEMRSSTDSRTINERELLEKQIELETYIEALKGTVDDLKMGLYTITLMDNIKEANKLAQNLLSDFYSEDNFIKKTTLDKEKELCQTANTKTK